MKTFVASLAFLFLAIPSYSAPTKDGIAITVTGKTRHWEKLPVRVCATASLPPQAITALEGAAAVWNSSFGKQIFETGCRANTQDFEAENPDEHSVFWVRKNFENSGDPLALARTLTSFDEDTGKFVDADILINAENFDWNTLGADLKSVLIHELGHVLGLQHLSVSSRSVMHQYPYQSGIIRHSLRDYELKAIGKQYFKKDEKIPAFIDPFFKGDLPGALTALKKEHPQDAESFYAEALLELTSKNPARAVTALKKSLNLLPDNPLAQYQLAVAYSQQKKSKESKAQLEATLRKFPNYYEALADLALIELEEGNRKKAIGLFKKALSVNPVHYPVCFYLFKLTGDAAYKRCVERFAPRES